MPHQKKNSVEVDVYETRGNKGTSASVSNQFSINHAQKKASVEFAFLPLMYV